MTLRLKLLTLYVCVGVAVLALVGGLLSAPLRQERSEEIGRGITNQLKHLDFALTSFLEEVENDVQALAADPLVRSRDDKDFTSFLDADEGTFVYSIGELEQSIIDTLNTFRTTHPYVNSVYMGRENGSFVRSHKRARPTQYDPRERPWYVLAKENPGEVMRTEPYRSVTTPDVNLGVVTALVDESGEVFGVVGADVTLANLTDYISAFEVGHEGHMLLVDEKGTVLANRDRGLLMTNIESLLGRQSEDLMDSDPGVLVFETDSGTQYLYSYTSPKLSWKIAAVIPREEINREIWSSVFVALLGLFLALVLLSVLTLVGLNAFVVNPLRNLNDVALDIARTGSLDRRIETQSTDELGSLAASFNQMIASIGDKESALRASEAELEKHRDHLEDLVTERTAELDTAVREMAVLNRVSRDLVKTLDLEALLPTVVQKIAEVVEADRCAVFLFDERVGVLRARAAHGYMAERLADFGYRPGEEIVGQAYATGETQYVPDLDLAPGLPRRDEIRAVLAVPLASPTVGPLGVLSVTSLQPEAFTPDQQQLLETMAGQIAGVIENARLYKAAQEADRLKSAFLATMSHELRTPLNSIIGFTGIILQGLVGPLNDEQAKQLGMVQGSAHHLLNLINDVLDISKIEAGQVEIVSEPFDMRQAIEKVMRTVTPLAEEKGLALVAEVAPEVGTITSDRRRVEQIVINLVNNAVKFTEQGEVRIICQVDDGWLVTRVIDMGIGIKPDDMGKLFETFRQIDSTLTRQHEGTGLGLSICQKLVEMLGGEIWAESEWGVGSTFTFTLPTNT